MCHICYKRKTPIEIVSDKLIMYIDGLNSSNSPRQIDHPKYTTLATDTITLDDIFQNYFKDSFLTMLYVKVVPRLVLKQENQHSQFTEL